MAHLLLLAQELTFRGKDAACVYLEGEGRIQQACSTDGQYRWVSSEEEIR